jgi:AcrR family transcriptional regulator
LKKGDATRARIIDEAARQAAKRGLGSVSLNDVATAVGLSKSGLFKHFDSKEAMQLAVVDEICNRFLEVVWAPAAALPPGRARLETAFRGVLTWSLDLWSETGCPICAFSLELDDQPGPLRDHLRGKLDIWRGMIVNEFRHLRQPPLSEAQGQAGYFQMRSFELGLCDARRMMGDGDAHVLAMTAFQSLLDRFSESVAA